MKEKDGEDNVCEVKLDSHGTGKHVTRHLNDNLKAAITRWVIMNILGLDLDVNVLHGNRKK